MESFREAVTQRRVRVITHTAAIDELRRVLAYPQCRLCAADQALLLDRYCMFAHQATLPTAFALGNLLLPQGFPRCRDTDDQHFLALAYHAKADRLLTKDRDLLRLKKRAARFGVTVMSPEDFVTQL